MGFIRRVLGLGAQPAREQEQAQAQARSDSSTGQDSRRTQTVLAALDIDAAINAHERWKARLMDYLEGRSTEPMDPDVIRQDQRSALGHWLHSAGAATMGHLPAFPLLMVRHQYFHEQAANMVALAQQGEWDKAVQILNGGYRHGSSQIVLLLKELKRGLEQ